MSVFIKSSLLLTSTYTQLAPMYTHTQSRTISDHWNECVNLRFKSHGKHRVLLKSERGFGEIAC